MPRRTIAVLSFVAFACSGDGAHAQCLDWSSQFAIPGLGINEEVFTLAVLDDGSGPALYAGGKFNTAGGVPALGVARWNGTGWSALGGGLGSVISGFGSVHALAVCDHGAGPVMYGAGQFSLLGGAPGNHIARWDGDSWGPVGSGLDNNASCLGVFDDGSGPALHVGGDFKHAGGVSANGVARWTGSAWESVASSGPGARSRHAMAYDAARQRVVAFGGTTPTGVSNETWEFDGASWVKRAVAGPAARIWHAMAYDSVRGRVVLFGGRTGTGGSALNDTWEFDGVSWVMRTPATTFPPVRFAHAMAFDAVSGRTLMFGGENNISGLYGDLWAWDGQDWSVAAPAGPSARRYAAMVFDDARGHTVLFGGVDAVGPKGDTWMWDGESWAPAAVASPGTRINHAMAYDSARARTVMFGGGNGVGGSDANTWEWDGTAWSLAATVGPAERSEAPMAYHAAAMATVVCGGGNGPLNDVWAWDGAAWTPIGGGCDRTPHTMFTYDDGSGPVLFVGGAFRRISGVLTGKLARWDGQAWSPAGPPILGSEASAIKSLTVFDDGAGPALYAGGSVPIGPVGATVVRWTGTAWAPVGNVSLGDVRALAVYDSGSGPELYAVGSISAPGTPPIVNVARWDGAVWSGVGAGTFGAPNSAAVFPLGSSSRLWVGGKFTHAGGVPSANIALWGEPCGPPVITLQPQSQTALIGQSVVFNMAAIGTAPLSYQWRHDGVPLATGGAIQGATTPTLTIGWWSLNHAGDYDIVVTNALGEVTSDPATLTIPGVGAGGPVALTRVLYPPEPVPSLPPGNNLVDFVSPVQAGDEGVGVLAYLNGTGSPHGAISFWQPTQPLQVLFQIGSQAPQTTPGVTFGQFNRWMAGREGRMVIDARLQGPGVAASNNDGLWFRDVQGSVRIVREGLEAPGLPAGAILMGPGVNRMSDDGRVAWSGAFDGGTPPQAGVGRWLWNRASGVSSLIVKTGDPVPGGGSITALEGPLQVNTAGEVLFGGGIGAAGYGLWSGLPGQLQTVARTGDPAPGNVPPQTQIASVSGAYALLSESGDVAFEAQLTGPGGYSAWAVLARRTGNLEQVVVQGDPAPGTSYEGSIAIPALHAFSDAGTSIVHASLVLGLPCSEFCPTQGLWLANGGPLVPIAMRWHPVPGGTPGMRLVGMGSPSAVNSLGQVVFGASIEFPVNATGVMGWTPTSGLFPVAMPGTQVAIGPGDYRTVADAYLSDVVGGVSGLRNSTSLLESGRVVIQLNFTDGTRGVFGADLPEFAGAYFPCPTVVAAPQPASVRTGQSVEFTVQAVGSAGPLSYQWRQNGAPLSNGGPISGATSATLAIGPAAMAHGGAYDVVISNPCGSIASPAAALTVMCYPDCNGDMLLSIADFGCFQAKFVGGDPYADCTGNGGLTIADFGCFQAAFAQACP